MPTYTYTCKANHELEENRRIDDRDAGKDCPTCGEALERIFRGAPMISVFRAGYNHSLGRYVGSQGDIRDAQNRIQDETGSRPIEIGNERPKHALVKQEFNMREAIALADQMQRDRGEMPK